MALTAGDIQKIKQLLEITIDERVEKIIDKKLEEKLKHLPTKEEYYAREDQMMAELKAIREELAVLAFHVSQHTD